LSASGHFINLTCFQQFCSLSEILEIKLKFQTAINSLYWHIHSVGKSVEPLMLHKTIQNTSG